MTAISTPQQATSASSTPSGAIRHLAEGNVAFLRQGIDLISRMGDTPYCEAPSVEAPGEDTQALFARGAVGAHFRHVIDHYVSFFEGLDGGTIDYDRRDREREVERDRALCSARLQSCIERLQGLAAVSADQPLSAVLGGAGHESGQALTGLSSASRELQFLASHTVHHYAIIAVIARLFGVEPGDEFGVAPSTLEYERGAGSCAR